MNEWVRVRRNNKTKPHKSAQQAKEEEEEEERKKQIYRKYYVLIVLLLLFNAAADAILFLKWLACYFYDFQQTNKQQTATSITSA